MDRQRQQRRRAGEGGGAEHRRDLLAEAAAGDQREPFDPLGELVEELHRDAAAERVSDDRRALDADRGQEVADARGMGAERVVAAGRGRVAVADQVRRDDRVRAGEVLRYAVPVARRVEHAVDQDHRWPVAGDPVHGPAPVKDDLPLLELRHRRGR